MLSCLHFCGLINGRHQNASTMRIELGLSFLPLRLPNDPGIFRRCISLEMTRNYVRLFGLDFSGGGTLAAKKQPLQLTKFLSGDTHSSCFCSSSMSSSSWVSHALFKPISQLRFDYDTTTTRLGRKTDTFIFLLASNRVEWKQARDTS